MAESEKPAAPKSGGKMLGLVFAAVNMVVLGLGLFLVYKATLGDERKSTSDADARAELLKFEESLRGAPVLYNMGQFNTNLDGVPRRMVRLDLSLEMMDEEGYEEVIGITPQARDAVMRILQDKTYSDVESVQGKLQLKNQILAQINADLKRGVVKNIYFNELVVQ